MTQPQRAQRFCGSRTLENKNANTLDFEIICAIIRGKLYKFTKVNKRGDINVSTSYKIIHKR